MPPKVSVTIKTPRTSRKKKSTKKKTRARTHGASSGPARPRGMRGRGDVFVPESQLARLGGQSAGRAIGGFIGAGIHRLIKTFTGVGDYRSSNAALHKQFQERGSFDRGTILKGDLPTFGAASHHVDISYRECVGTVVGTANFSTTTYYVNPANPVAFPWLSTIAPRFAQYQPNGIVFMYIPTVGSYSASGALGSVTMHSYYDRAEPLPVSYVQAADSEFASSARADENLLHMIECKRNEAPVNVFFTRGTNGPPTRDAEDVCRTCVSTEGCPTEGAVIGHLFVVYNFRLLKPNIQSGPYSTARWTFTYTYGPAGDYYALANAGAGKRNDIPAYWIKKPSGLDTELRLVMQKAPGVYHLRIVCVGSAGCTGSASLPNFNAVVAAGMGLINSSTTDSENNVISGSVASYDRYFLYSPITPTPEDWVFEIRLPTWNSGTTVYYTFELSRVFNYDGVALDVPNSNPPHLSANDTTVTWTLLKTMVSDDGTMTQKQYPYDGPYPPDGVAVSAHPPTTPTDDSDEEDYPTLRVVEPLPTKTATDPGERKTKRASSTK